MEKKSSKIKERILQIAMHKRVSKELFISDLGMTYGNFKGKSKQTPLNSNTIEDIITKYPDIDPDWLLTGKGSMLRSKEEEETDPDNCKKEETGNYCEKLKQYKNEHFVERYQFLEEKIKDKDEAIAALKLNNKLLKEIIDMLKNKVMEVK